MHLVSAFKNTFAEQMPRKLFTLGMPQLIFICQTKLQTGSVPSEESLRFDTSDNNNSRIETARFTQGEEHFNIIRFRFIVRNSCVKHKSLRKAECVTKFRRARKCRHETTRRRHSFLLSFVLRLRYLSFLPSSALKIHLEIKRHKKFTIANRFSEHR